MVVILAGTLLRYLLIAQGWPAAYNDEGTLGLMALHVAYQGAHPLLYYGQNYLGSLEAYIGAGFFHLLGPSTFALRLGLLPLFALFLTCMYLLASLLYTKSLALISLIVLALGSPDIFLRQLMAAGGTPEMLFFTALLLLLTAWLILSAPAPENVRDGPPGEEALATARVATTFKTDKSSMKLHAGESARHLRWTRLAAYGAWGIVAGLDLWSHLLCLPFVLCAGALLLFFCRRELRLPALALLLAALLLGLSPLIIYNITTPITANELSLFTGAFGGGYREPSYPVPQSTPGAKKPAQHIVSAVAPEPIPPRPVLQIGGTLLVGIPVITNGMALCPLDSQQAWPLAWPPAGQPGAAYTISCSAAHGAWGIMLVALWCAAVIAAWRRFWRDWRAKRNTPPASTAGAQQREAKRQAARLMILAAAGLTTLAFVLYPQASSVSPWISARYLIGLLIATPALLAPLWQGATTPAASPSWPARLATRCLLLIILASSLLGTINTFTQQISSAHAGDQIQKDLIARLLQLQANKIYTDYEDCTRLAFLSNERIVCAVLDNGLQPGLDRYFPYRAIVAGAPHPFYVFRQGSPQSILFEQAAAAQHISYTRSLVDGYIIYDPGSRVAT